jgi:hypothetical protein
MLESAMKGVVFMGLAVLAACWVGYAIDKMIPRRRGGRSEAH